MKNSYYKQCTISEAKAELIFLVDISSHYTPYDGAQFLTRDRKDLPTLLPLGCLTLFADFRAFALHKLT
jgi:hypothetical protein